MPSGQSVKGQLIFLVVLAAIFLFWNLAAAAVGFYTDWLWFTSVGYQSIFITILQAKVLAFLLGAVAFLVPAAVSLLVAQVVMSRQRKVSIREEKGIAYIVQLGQDVPRRLVTLVALLAAAGLAFISGMSASGQWEAGLRFLNAKSFGVADPLFGQDVGFYFFTLPLYGFAQGWLFWSLVAILGLTALIYMVSIAEGNITLDPGIFVAHRAAKVHVMVLATLAALAVAISYRLQIFGLVYAARAVTSGAGYTDATARQTALWVLMGLMVVIAVLFLVSAFSHGFSLPIYGVGLWVVAAIVLGAIYPSVVQNLQVAPNELQKEQPYIDASIKMTRQAFGLGNIQEQDFQAADAVTAGEVNDTPDTINNIRLWDYRPLLQTYNQIQSIRLYYDFNNIGIDRYTIGGQYRQVMLAARELAPDKLASQAQNWVTRHLQFTHGYGLAMSPVNAIVGEGLPDLLVKDIPPVGDMKIDKPQIYYGLTDPGYAVVKTTAQEFDYPKGDDNVYGSYQGDGGVKVDSLLRKLAYAWYFKDGNILFSSYFTPDSKILYVRDIQDRISKVTPFLTLDKDPYMVVADGQLFWIQDAYTSSAAYPYSAVYQEQTTATVQTAQGGQQVQQVRTGRAFNYIRNSVKVVVNAYDGSMRYYLADPGDPLVSSYASIFPGLFAQMDQMPASIKAHIRYPEDLFRAQANMYSTFHMQDPQVFYNREDLWNISSELVGDTKQPIEPYFVIMKLPGEPREEFLEMLPYSPSNKDNMIAWLAARSDVANYGKLVVYKYPKDKLSYGPSQIEARVNQDPTISAQFTLWGQSGSSVTRGNLLVIPVGKANLYVMPIYLQASAGSIPELKRVILSTGNKVVMEATLGDALSKLFDGKVTVGGAQPAPAAQPAAQPAPAGQPAPSAAQPSATPAPGAPASVADLIKSAQDHYNAAQDRLKASDWAGYGDEMKKLQSDLNALSAQAR